MEAYENGQNITCKYRFSAPFYRTATSETVRDFHAFQRGSSAKKVAQSSRSQLAETFPLISITRRYK